MIGVVASASAYRAAVGELPMTTTLEDADAGEGSILVVAGGSGWPRRAAAAAEQGASALVVCDPRPAPGDETLLRALADRLPVVLDRPLLRQDVVLDVLGGPTGSEPPPESWALVSALCSAPPGRLAAVLTDALGWLRVLLGPLETEAATGMGEGVLAQVRGPRGEAALTSRVLAEATAGPRIAVTAVAPRRLQIAIAPGSSPSVSWCDERGVAGAPARFEGRERLSLRRAVAALASAEHPADLHDWLEDSCLAEDLVSRLPS